MTFLKQSPRQHVMTLAAILIRIIDQWRICFIWPESDVEPSYIEIVDYH